MFSKILQDVSFKLAPLNLHTLLCALVLVLKFITLTVKAFVTGFWKTDHIVTFDIIDNSVYLRHSEWYFWMNTCLNQSQIT